MLPVGQAASDDLAQLLDALAAFLVNFWWVPVIVSFAWYLRWYHKAEDAGVDTPSVKGFRLWLEDVFGTTTRAIAIVGIVIVGLLSFLAFSLNILPAVGAGVVSADPVVLSLVAGMVAAGAAALDVELATPRNTAVVVAAVFVFVVVADWAFAEIAERVD